MLYCIIEEALLVTCITQCCTVAYIACALPTYSVKSRPQILAQVLKFRGSGIDLRDLFSRVQYQNYKLQPRALVAHFPFVVTPLPVHFTRHHVRKKSFDYLYVYYFIILKAVQRHYSTTRLYCQ